MTFLLDRTAPADPEKPPVTTPPYSRSLVPWWAGVPGLDPALPVTDWAIAAQCTAMACAVHLFGTDAGYDERRLPRKASPVSRWLDWLLGSVNEADATRRRLALRLMCEQYQAGPDADAVITDAEQLVTATARR